MKKYGMSRRDKSDAQKVYLQENPHPMAGKSHREETKLKISKSLESFWDNLSPEDEKELRQKMGSGWKAKWGGMSQDDRDDVLRNMSSHLRAAKNKGSKLENYLAEQFRVVGYVVDVRTTLYTPGKAFEVDIALPEINVMIEVDGPTHHDPIFGDDVLVYQENRDERKNDILLSQGYHVVRILDKNGPLSMLRFRKIHDTIKSLEGQPPQLVIIEQEGL
jgi:very-short-patch-repair endonuclease